MTGWTKKTLEEVVELRRGFDLPHHSRVPGNYPVLTSGASDGWHNEGPIKGPGLAIGRATNLGQPTWSESDYWPLNTTLYAANFHGNLPRWVFHLFEVLDLTGFDSGSVQPMLNRNYIAKLPITVPPFGDQVAIAEVLGALDDKIAVNTAISNVTDEYLATEFDALLLGGSVDVPLATIANTNELTRKPVDGEKIRYVDIAAVGVGTHNVPKPIDWDEAPGRARRGFRRGDTLWSTVRPNRRSHSLNLSSDQDLVGSTGLAVLTPTSVGFAYLYEVTKRLEFTSYLETVAEGSAYPAVRADRFGAAQVPLLPETQLNAFESIAAPMREHLHSLSQENIQLAATRDALLPQLMSGKLRVRDAERVLENAGV